MLDFLVSLGVAVLSGLGVGSGGLLVVFLTQFRGIGQLVAQGINLLFFLFSSASSTAVNIRIRNIDPRVVLPLSLGGAVGSIIGASVASRLPPDVLRVGFGAMLLLGGVPALIKTIGAFGKKKGTE